MSQSTQPGYVCKKTKQKHITKGDPIREGGGPYDYHHNLLQCQHLLTMFSVLY